MQSRLSSLGDAYARSLVKVGWAIPTRFVAASGRFVTLKASRLLGYPNAQRRRG